MSATLSPGAAGGPTQGPCAAARQTEIAMTRVQPEPPEERPPHGASIVGGIDRDSPGPGPFVMAADTLEGDKVVDPAGDEIGTIDHIMIDVLGGRVAYAVLAMGGFLGIGEKLFAFRGLRSRSTPGASVSCSVLKGTGSRPHRDLTGTTGPAWRTRSGRPAFTSITGFRLIGRRIGMTLGMIGGGDGGVGGVFWASAHAVGCWAWRAWAVSPA